MLNFVYSYFPCKVQVSNELDRHFEVRNRDLNKRITVIQWYSQTLYPRTARFLDALASSEHDHWRW